MKKTHKKLLLYIMISFISFGFNPFVWAGFDEAQKAYDNKDYKTAFKEFSLLARQGNKDAQIYLAYMYDNGFSVPKNEQQSAVWYLKAAEQGEKTAQFNLAVKYEYGRGVPKDANQAVSWYRKAAEQDDIYAQFNLAKMYENGRGIPINELQAFYWYRKAAEQGNPNAQFSLGLHYAKGLGVSKDYSMAVKWIKKAAEKNHTQAQYAMGVAFDFGQGVEKDEKEAAVWYGKSADQGHSEAQYALGQAFAYGQGVQKDEMLSANWYIKAAEQGHANAQFNLATIYGSGKGVLKDDEKAVAWYRKAAEQGQENAQYNLGVRYIDGRGVSKDEQQAYFWWLLAGAKGIENAKLNISIVEKVLLPHQRAQAQLDARNWRPKNIQEALTKTFPVDIPDSLKDSAELGSNEPKIKGEKSSGTGFVVSQNKIVTNVHVVEGCTVLKVNGENATVRAKDITNDLALLNTSLISGVATLGSVNLRQGDVINAVGYPLHGLLASGAQITSGNVSALAGMQNDSRFIQISAPVQPGNSGGPLVDASGNVVGVIVSKLNAVAIASVNGDIPQNINFAISPLVLKGFLEANQVKYKTAGSNKNLSTTNVMSIAIRYTVLIECTK